MYLKLTYLIIPLINLIFFPEENFSDVGGWVGRSGGGAQAAIPPPTPAPGTGKLWSEQC